MNPEVLQKLQEQDWNALGRRLVVHVCRRGGIRAWKEGARNIALGLGKSPEDIVADVITKVLAGERIWDPKRGALLPTLKAIADSELDHLWSRQARRREKSTPEDVGKREQQESAALEVDPPAGPVDPEEVLEKWDDMIGASARVSALLSSIGDEPDLQEVVEAVMDGCESTPRHLAQRLDVPVKDINNRLRRLRRRVTE